MAKSAKDKAAKAAKSVVTAKKGGAVPVQRTKKQKLAAEARARKKSEERDLERARTKQQQQAARLAQVVNLRIAGHSPADIGASIGASAEEVDQMLQSEVARYVRTQPALRMYVRDYISGKYTELLDAVWNEATDRHHPMKLENSAQALRLLDKLGKLHGADAPAQTEVKVEAMPEAVDAMVRAISAANGVGYDESIFDDVVDAEIVEEAAEAMHVVREEAGTNLALSSSAVAEIDEELDQELTGS